MLLPICAKNILIVLRSAGDLSAPRWRGRFSENIHVRRVFVPVAARPHAGGRGPRHGGPAARRGTGREAAPAAAGDGTLSLKGKTIAISVAGTDHFFDLKAYQAQVET